MQLESSCWGHHVGVIVSEVIGRPCMLQLDWDPVGGRAAHHAWMGRGASWNAMLDWVLKQASSHQDTWVTHSTKVSPMSSRGHEDKS